MTLFVRDTTCEHGITRARERCRMCEPDYFQMVPVQGADRRERIATALMVAGRGNPIECVETADQLDRALTTIPVPSKGE